MRKLSKAQLEVVSILKSDYFLYIRKNKYYHFQEIIDPNGRVSEYCHMTYHVHYFTEPTFDFLLKNGIIKEVGQNKYKLT